LDDNLTEAKVMKAAFDDVRDAVLREAKPLCATFRASLVQTTAPDFGWDNAYQLPTDPYCLSVNQVNGLSNKSEWTVEGRKLLTNNGTAQIKYTGRVTDTGQLDPLVVTALAARLAAETCYALTQNRALSNDMWTLALSAKEDVLNADGMEQGSEIIEATTFANARS
jgi:hypothetical protein